MSLRGSVALLLLGACATSPAGGSAGVGSETRTSTGSEASGEATGEPTGGTTSNGTTGVGGGGLLLVGGAVVGRGIADVRIVDGKISEVGTLTPAAGEQVVDMTGRWLAPAFIDSHVHLLYLPMAEELAAGGVAGAVDLAAPVEIFTTSMAPLRVLAAGPMVTAIAGYPTQSWGSGGYGIECADAAAATAAVEKLHGLGAAMIKLPVTGGPQLADDALAAATRRAHELGLPVVSHALADDEARRAALAGVDVLAHTPTEPLLPATVKSWSGRAVISTLRAFGGSSATVANLSALRAAGATVVYGTDFGNTSTPGIDAGELMLLQQAGLTPQEIVAAGTSAPAALWSNFNKDLGAIAPGKDASILVLAADPYKDVLTLSKPAAVYVRGVLQEP